LIKPGAEFKPAPVCISSDWFPMCRENREYAILFPQEASDLIMKVKVLGAHNIESRRTRQTSLLIDGILALDAGGLTSSLSFRDQAKIKAVLLTHAHYDHIRDIPALAMNLFLQRKSLEVYSHQDVLEKLKQYFLDGTLYPEFDKRPPDNPVLSLHLLEAYQESTVAGYRVLPLPVQHAIPAMGYQVTSADGKTIFYSGDTGANLAELWKRIAPQVLFIELTAPNRWEEAVKRSGHLTPNLLKGELSSFHEIHGYLPRVIAIHINPLDEKETRSEISEVANQLGASIEMAREGLQLLI
jgi:ribonuclease BN (tRNA processing enzyme)